MVIVTEQKKAITIRLPPEDLKKIESILSLQDIDRTTLLREFIKDGLRNRVIALYKTKKLTASKAAEIIGMPLRRFLELLETEGVSINWDSKIVEDYLKNRYGE